MPVGSMAQKNKMASKGASRSGNSAMVRAARRASWSGGLGNGSRTLAVLPSQRGLRGTVRKNVTIA